jgi:glucosamine 6-phosphate synthetase-like amidotransferase/phosphosugar isomerase protein
MNWTAILGDLLAIPKAMLGCLRYYLTPEGKSKLDHFRQTIITSKIRRIIFIGHSYNYYASLIPFYYLNSRYRSLFNSETREYIKKDCLIFESDEFYHELDTPSFYSDSIFVLISQSGESIQIIQNLKKLQDVHIDPDRIWAVTNHPESLLAKSVHGHLPILAGNEEILGTKTYVNAILILFFLARAFLDEEPISAGLEDEIRQEIFEIKFFSQDWEAHIKSLSDFLGEDYRFLYFISKGSSLASAYHGSLTCKAYARTYGEGISIGLFMHGPFQIVDDRFHAVVIIGDETSVEDTLQLLDVITKKLGSGKVILINNSRELSSRGRANPNIFVFEHTTKNTYLAPIFEYIVLQYLLLHKAKGLGE